MVVELNYMEILLIIPDNLRMAAELTELTLTVDGNNVMNIRQTSAPVALLCGLESSPQLTLV
jgi:hypothetical protein